MYSFQRLVIEAYSKEATKIITINVTQVLRAGLPPGYI